MAWSHLRAAFALRITPREASPGEHGAVDPTILKFVVLVLANHANAQGVAYPGVDLIAQTTQTSRKTVTRALAELEARGLVKIRAYGKGGRGRATEYVLSLPVAELSTENGETGTVADSVSPPVERAPGVDTGTETTETGTRERQTGTAGDSPTVEPQNRKTAGHSEPSPSGPADRAGADAGTADAVAASSRSASFDPGPQRQQLSEGRAQGSSHGADPVRALLASLLEPERGANLVMGWRIADVAAALRKLEAGERATLTRWCHMMRSREGATPGTIRNGVAVIVMRNVRNPFGYFAAGTQARKQIERE